jgi:uncharacterized ion transporter superfamily protein YfcC
MNESSISTTRLVIATMWCLVFATQATAWIVAMTTDNWHLAVLVAFCVVPAATAAGVAHIRGYACRVSRQVRAVELSADRGDLRPLK